LGATATGAGGDGALVATAATVGGGAEIGASAGASGADLVFFGREGATGCGLLYLATAFGAAGAGCDGVGCVLAAFATGAGFVVGAGAVTTVEAVADALTGWFEELAAGADAAIITSG